MNTKRFDDYLRKRFTPEEMEEIQYPRLKCLKPEEGIPWPPINIGPKIRIKP